MSVSDKKAVVVSEIPENILLESDSKVFFSSTDSEPKYQVMR
jgi:hypothetical protein